MEQLPQPLASFDLVWAQIVMSLRGHNFLQGWHMQLLIFMQTARRLLASFKQGMLHPNYASTRSNGYRSCNKILLH